MTVEQAAPPSTGTAKRDKPSPPKASAKPASPPAVPTYVQCDANIQAKQGTTTCEFAQNVFWHYWTNAEATDLIVWSPAAHQSFETSCSGDGEVVNCTTTDGGEVKFLAAALDSYSQAQQTPTRAAMTSTRSVRGVLRRGDPLCPGASVRLAAGGAPGFELRGEHPELRRGQWVPSPVCRRDVLPIGWNPGCLLRSRGSWLDPDGSQTQPGRGGFTDATVHLARPERSPGGVDRRAVEAQPHPAPVLSLIAEVVAA